MSDDEDEEESILRSFSRARRAAVAVGVPGLVLGVLAGGLLDGGPAPSVLLGPACGLLLGASTLIVTTFRAATRMRRLAGGWTTTSDRIGRVLGGSTEPLSSTEAAAARRYAAVYEPWLRLQIADRVMTTIAVVLALAGLAVAADAPAFSLLFGAFLVLTSAFTTAARLQQARRVRAWSDAHTADVEGAPGP